MPNCPTCHDTRIIIRRDGYDSDDHHFVETASHLVPCPACSGLLSAAHKLYEKYDLSDEVPFGDWMRSALQEPHLTTLDALDCDGLARVEQALLGILQGSKKCSAAEAMHTLFGTIREAYAKGLQTRHLFAQASWWVAADQQAEYIARHNQIEDETIANAKRG